MTYPDKLRIPVPEIQRETALTCDLCGHPVQELHCKIRCFNCGFTRDCTDP